MDEEVKSQRMKTELITNVSHDLKTPLTAIITLCQSSGRRRMRKNDRIMRVLEESPSG
ncbi:MAG: histidine kinase dimerization/phospho-acceptor domain-containing protein [[Clostridium] scindens]